MKPHLREQWVIPPGEDAAFVASMEHVLDCYQRPLNAEFPVVNMDEQPVQLKADVRIGTRCVPVKSSELILSTNVMASCPFSYSLKHFLAGDAYLCDSDGQL